MIALILRLPWLSPWFCNAVMSGFPFQWILFKRWGLTFSVFSVRLIMSFLILLFTFCFFLISSLNIIPSRSLTVVFIPTKLLLPFYSVVILIYQTSFCPFLSLKSLSLSWLGCSSFALCYNIGLFLTALLLRTPLWFLSQVANLA